MANVTSPLAAPFASLKQVGSQAVNSVNSLNLGVVTSLNQGLDALAAGAPPPLPGLPGAGGQSALPTPASLMPANLSQALSGIQNVLIPPGLPKLAQTTPTAPPAPPPQPQSPQAPVAPTSAPSRITQYRGM